MGPAFYCRVFFLPCLVYIPHTTTAVTINESSDPVVKVDSLMILNEMVPWKANYLHKSLDSRSKWDILYLPVKRQ